jgi:hypothetical protein
MSALSDLYALIPAQGYILGADLPAVFAQYEAQRGTDLLQPSEREALVAFGKQNAGERVDAEVLVSLMGQLLGAGAAASQGRPEDTDKGNPSIGGVESGRITSAPFRGAFFVVALISSLIFAARTGTVACRYGGYQPVGRHGTTIHADCS